MHENLLTFVEPAQSHHPDNTPDPRPDFETLGRLVAEIAHEARNPLASILAGLEAWADEPEAPFDLFGSRIQREANRLAALMECLLELARPSRLRREAVSLRTLAEDAVSAADLALRASKVELETDLRTEGEIVDADPAALRRMIQNLLDNAIQHSSPGQVVRLSLRAEGASVVIAIQDRGPGFAPEDLERAFEPFFSRRRGGSGLGLAIVQKVVTEHDGEIDLRNRQDGGAEATVTLRARGHEG